MAPTTESRMNMENMSKAELLLLFSVLEGELEARDLVIEALRAQHRNSFVRERYGKFNLSDPFLALQRDGEAVRSQGGPSSSSSSSSSPSSSSLVGEAAVHPDPLAVLKLVVGHCRRMQEKMLAQLAAAENRHRRVIADLEEEKRRHAEDTAEGDDVTCILEKERERLQHQLEFERGQSRRLEREHRRLQDQLEEERSTHKQLASALARECQRATSRLTEEGQRASEASRRLERERLASQSLRTQLEAERRRALQTEARAEEQLAEVDTEKEQLRARLRREEAQGKALQQEVERLKEELERALQAAGGGGGGGGSAEESKPKEGVQPKEEVVVQQQQQQQQPRRRPLERSSVTTQMDSDEEEEAEEEVQQEKESHQMNGQQQQPEGGKTNGVQNSGHPENGSCPPSPSPHTVHIQQQVQQGQSLTLTASPCSSPMLAKRAGQAPQQSTATSSATTVTGNATTTTGVTSGSGGSGSVTLQSSYQAGIHQRFHAARHKFQGHPDPDPQAQPGTGNGNGNGNPSSSSSSRGSEVGSPSSPRALSPCSTPSPDSSPARQMARSTVTQVLSRFTVQQPPGSPKSPPATGTGSAATANNSSPFGTDYRNMAPSSPSLPRGTTSSSSGMLSPGIRSPVIPRAERGQPPPIPPKKPGLAQAPPSPATVARAGHHNHTTTSSNHFTEPLSPGSCGLTSGQDGVKELDMVLSSSG